jgi:hypothetical protein
VAGARGEGLLGPFGKLAGGGATMVYLWAGVRTIAVLFGVLVALSVVLTAAASVVWAFNLSFAVGCVALAAVAGIVSLFGYQLGRVAKISRTKQMGALIGRCGGSVAILAMAGSLVGYGYDAMRPALKPANIFDQFDPPQSRSGGMFDDLIPPKVIPQPPPGFVLDEPTSRPRMTPKAVQEMTDNELIAAYRAKHPESSGGNKERIVRFEGRDIRVSADWTDEEVVRVLEGLSKPR